MLLRVVVRWSETSLWVRSTRSASMTMFYSWPVPPKLGKNNRLKLDPTAATHNLTPMHSLLVWVQSNDNYHQQKSMLVVSSPRLFVNLAPTGFLGNSPINMHFNQEFMAVFFERGRAMISPRRKYSVIELQSQDGIYIHNTKWCMDDHAWVTLLLCYELLMSWNVGRQQIFLSWTFLIKNSFQMALLSVAQYKSCTIKDTDHLQTI